VDAADAAASQEGLDDDLEDDEGVVGERSQSSAGAGSRAKRARFDNTDASDL
jgi:hypothetical protein